MAEVTAEKGFTNRLKYNFVVDQLKRHGIGNQEILELGSGSGWLTRLLRGKGYCVTSFDKDNRADIQADFSTYKFDKNYKAIVALEFLEHGFFTEKVMSILDTEGILIATFPNPRFDGLMQFLAWNGIYNSQWKYHYLEHVNLFYPEEVPLQLVAKKSILWVCFMACWKKK